MKRAVRELNRVVKTGFIFGSVTSDMAPALIDRYDLLFLSGQMSPQMRSVLTTRLNAVGGSGNERTRRRVQHALYLILNSPEYAIQK